MTDIKVTDIKVNVVGDKSCGQVALVVAYTTSAFIGDFVPTVVEAHHEHIVIDGEHVNLHLWNTAAWLDNKESRSKLYPETKVVVICFSLVDPSSLEDVPNEWLPEIKEYCPGVPYILVGTQSELRDRFAENADEYRSKGWEPVPTSRGEEMKRAIEAKAYIECSAKLQLNVKEVFQTAIKVVIHAQPPAQSDKGCEIA
jgi:Ras-related C3 botulinum toxin substrate 1